MAITVCVLIRWLHCTGHSVYRRVEMRTILTKRKRLLLSKFHTDICGGAMRRQYGGSASGLFTCSFNITM